MGEDVSLGPLDFEGLAGHPSEMNLDSNSESSCKTSRLRIEILKSSEMDENG